MERIGRRDGGGDEIKGDVIAVIGGADRVCVDIDVDGVVEGGIESSFDEGATVDELSLVVDVDVGVAVVVLVFGEQDEVVETDEVVVVDVEVPFERNRVRGVDNAAGDSETLTIASPKEVKVDLSVAFIGERIRLAERPIPRGKRLSGSGNFLARSVDLEQLLKHDIVAG